MWWSELKKSRFVDFLSTHFNLTLELNFYILLFGHFTVGVIIWMSLNLHLCVCRQRTGGMVSPQPVTTLGRRWRPGREGRGLAWAGKVPGRWFSIRTPRVSVLHYGTSSFTLQSPPCTLTSRWDPLQVLDKFKNAVNQDKTLLKGVEL